MTVTIRQVGPCFAAEVDGIDMRKPLSARRGGGDPCRHGQVRRAGVPRPGHRRRAAARLHPEPGRHRARHRHQPARGQRVRACRRPSPTCPTSTRTTSCSRATTAAGCSPSATACGTPTARSRRCRPSTRCCARVSIPSKGGDTRVRRHARGLRCARRRDQGGGRGHGLRALADVLARSSSASPTSPTRSASASSRCGSAWSAPIRRPAASRSISPRTPARIVGWPMPEARGFLRDLIEHATQRQFVYAHKWRVGDLVMWDNRQTMHRARPFPAPSRATCGAPPWPATGRRWTRPSWRPTQAIERPTRCTPTNSRPTKKQSRNRRAESLSRTI